MSRLALPVYRPLFLKRDQDKFNVKFIGVYDDLEYRLGTVYAGRLLFKAVRSERSDKIYNIQDPNGVDIATVQMVVQR